jgi:hypothetical protein
VVGMIPEPALQQLGVSAGGEGARALLVDLAKVAGDRLLLAGLAMHTLVGFFLAKAGLGARGELVSSGIPWKQLALRPLPTVQSVRGNDGLGREIFSWRCRTITVQTISIPSKR